MHENRDQKDTVLLDEESCFDRHWFPSGPGGLLCLLSCGMRKNTTVPVDLSVDAVRSLDCGRPFRDATHAHELQKQHTTDHRHVYRQTEQTDE